MNDLIEPERKRSSVGRGKDVAHAMVTRWAIAWETTLDSQEVARDGSLEHDALVRFASRARHDYIRTCPRFDAAIRRGLIRIHVTGLSLVGSNGAFATGETVRIAASLAELRPSSFDLALRISGLNRSAPPIANVRCSITLVDRATGAPRIIPGAIRDEIIAREREADYYS